MPSFENDEYFNLERMQEEMSDLLKNSNSIHIPISQVEHLSIHERSLISLSRILNFVKAVQDFEEKPRLEKLINEVIPLEHFSEIKKLLI